MKNQMEDDGCYIRIQINKIRKQIMRLILYIKWYGNLSFLISIPLVNQLCFLLTNLIKKMNENLFT